MGGIALGGAFMLSPIEDLVAQSTQKVNRNSAPSDLKITDMRYCVTTVLGRTAIIRIDTNQGIYGLGEVRDGADERYALMLKSRILGMNPCNVEQIFKSIKQFGGQSRQAGGVCGVDYRDLHALSRLPMVSRPQAPEAGCVAELPLNAGHPLRYAGPIVASSRRYASLTVPSSRRASDSS